MWTSSTSRSPSSSRRRQAPALLALGIAFASAAPAGAKVLLSQGEALALVFGGADAAERRTAYLTDEQAGRIAREAGTPPSTRAVVYYAGGPDPNRPLTAYFDTHLVRTFPETIMVVVGPDGRAARVDVLSFDEPEEYLPKERWLQQFPGRALGADLAAGRGIRAVTGATLSSRAVADAVRRVLALHAILHEPPAGGASP